jgi:hypothetical protein
MSNLFLNFCIDTEGPLVETIGATFKRVKDIFGISLEPSVENLKKIQLQQLENIESSVLVKMADVFSENRLNYASDWNEIKRRMDKALDPDFRQKFTDKAGQGLIYNFYVADFTGFKTNPRQKCIEPHGIYDFYQNHYWNSIAQQDGRYWHYHHVPQSGACHEWGRCLSTSGEYDRIMARNLLERDFLPSVFRAGGHVEREDFSFWLERWFPFDFSNHSIPGKKLSVWDDWTRAPQSWQPYHPDFYDYQIEGKMRRSIFRCLDIDTREYCLDEEEVEKAFLEALEKPTILSLYTHDYRDVVGEVEYAMDIIKKIHKKYSQVNVLHQRSLSAARKVVNITAKSPEFKFDYKKPFLTIQCNTPIWGTQPFLAYKTFDGEMHHDNLLRTGQQGEYRYYFSKPEDVEIFGIGVIDPSGETLIKKYMPV